MCGIAGFLETTSHPGRDDPFTIADRMAETLQHRGPDDGGAWVDPERGIGLSYRRLAVVELSSHGRQPMHSASGRYVIIFNGEIYNYKHLRAELEARAANPPLAWRGHSDTEVMLAAISHWGLEAALKRFNGMFAFALWDRHEACLHLVRDRLGEKPLYYGWMGNTFLFGSELKALRAHPAFRAEINRNALALFLRHSYIPAPYSIYQGIFKLPPGTMLTLSRTSASETATPVPYWSAREIAERGALYPFDGTIEEATQCLDGLLREAVKLRMEADVPLGAFLSGGIDSSTVVAMMQDQSDRPVKTFTIGFSEPGYNEADHAMSVAQHLGTKHTELYVTSSEAMSVIPLLPALYDEPFSDPSQIPTHLVSRLARQDVTVSLSGDGGDELFCGYRRYWACRELWNRVGWMPFSVRQGLSRVLEKASARKLADGFHWLAPVINRYGRPGIPGDKLSKLAEILDVRDPEEMYLGLVSHWKNPASVVQGSAEPLTALTDRGRWASLPTITQRMMYLDLVSYLPDDILVKVDRASMGISLEARVPLLDHRAVEFVWLLPLSMKAKGSEGKWILRRVLAKYLPMELIERPKMGFGVPIGSWLRGSLRDWAEELLNESRMRQEGFFDPRPIRQKFKEHLSGERNWQGYLWDVLMFQAWLEAT
jgi:asparagine synthase (glutamine-hydrolysing)